MIGILRPSLGSRFWKLMLAYVVDWIVVIVLSAGFFGLEFVRPFERVFDIEDSRIMYPFMEHDTVSTSHLVLIALACPLLIIFLISIVLRRSLHDFHHGALGLSLGLSLTIMITQILKISVGKHRPDFLDRCKPRTSDGNIPTNPPLRLLTMSVCTTDIYAYSFFEGMKSFPSGHSSFSFAGMTFLALFIAGKLRVFDQKGHTFKGFVVFSPLVFALLVAISRVDDYRHHWEDVTVGAIIGMGFSFFSYRQYYPSLSSAHSEQPFAPRVKPHIHDSQTHNGTSRLSNNVNFEFMEEP